MATRLTLSEVTKSYRAGGRTIQALSGVSLTVAEGEFFSIIGPSGCGKTTILNLVAGFLAPDGGSILWDGRPVAGPDARRTMVFQDYALFPWLTVRDNVAFPLRMRGCGRAAARRRVEELLGQVHLEEFARQYPRQLSGGMKQRVAIARALAADPDIILLDEPFAALDALTRELLQEELLAICRRSAMTVLLVTHNIEEAVFLSDTVAVLSARPARVKEIVPIPLPRPRNRELKHRSGEFIRLKEHLSDLLAGEARLALG